jgi:hypothetical protein
MLRFAAVGKACLVSLLSDTTRTVTPLRNFDTKLHHPYRYESASDNRLESVANAHTAADLRARPDPQSALV